MCDQLELTVSLFSFSSAKRMNLSSINPVKQNEKPHRSKVDFLKERFRLNLCARMLIWILLTLTL